MSTPINASAPLAGNRTHIDYSAVSILHHRHEYRLGAQKGAFEINANDSIKILFRCINDFGRLSNTSIIDKNVNALEFLQCSLNHALHASMLANVNLESESMPTYFCDLFCHILSSQQIQVGNNNIRSLS